MTCADEDFGRGSAVTGQVSPVVVLVCSASVVTTVFLQLETVQPRQ